jgi:hypothetical protein
MREMGGGQQIDDHADDGGLRLLVGEHTCDDLTVLGGRLPAGGRALHRMGLDEAVLVDGEEEFR